jgi:hypothetical protein
VNRHNLSRILSGPAAPILLFLLALALRVFWILYYQFDGLYGQDAYAYYQYARELHRALAQFQPPPPFWWPLGYPALLVPAFAVGGSETPFAQHLTVLCGALIAPLAYALTREAAPRGYKIAAGWVAGLICAVGGQAVQSSVVIMADVPALMWAALASWLLLRHVSTRSIWTLVLASIAVGLSVWTRWQNLIFAAVWFAAWLSAQFTPSPSVNDGPSAWRAPAISTTLFRALLIVGIITLVLLPQFLSTTAAAAPFAGSSWLEGWRPQNAIFTSFDTVDGHFDYTLPVALFYAQVFVHPAYNVILLLPFFLLGAYVLLRNFRSMPPAAVLLLGWILAMYLFLAGIPYQNFRFPLGFFVPVAAVTGIGAGFLWHRWRASRTRWLLVAWIGLALAVMVFWQPRVLAPVIEIKRHELARMSTLHLYMGAGDRVWTLGFSGALNDSVPVNARELWGVTLDDIKSNRTSYLYIDVPNIESQWSGREPQQLYHALRDANMLQELAQIEGWTLFEIPPTHP